jgi:hypothetical protein
MRHDGAVQPTAPRAACVSLSNCRYRTKLQMQKIISAHRATRNGWQRHGSSQMQFRVRTNCHPAAAPSCRDALMTSNIGDDCYNATAMRAHVKRFGHCYVAQACTPGRRVMPFWTNFWSNFLDCFWYWVFDTWRLTFGLWRGQENIWC